jgi:hypothetical protein
MVVQRVVGDTEEGRYIINPLSSYVPWLEPDGGGFTFGAGEKCLARDFKRMKKK